MSKSQYFIGIDPGAKGAICLLCVGEDKTTLDFLDNDTSVEILHRNLSKVSQLITMAMIEDVHSLHGMSAKSNFSFGWNVGMLRTLLDLQSFGHDLVKPKEWQKGVGVSVPQKFKGSVRSKMLKNAVADMCERLYPGCQIRGPQGGLKDGRSDALMIAHFCRLKYKT